MSVVVTISIFALFLTYLAGKERLKYGLELAFILLTTIGAIHYDYGSDYFVYITLFEQFSTDVSSYSQIEFRDPGFVLLCRLCKPIGFFGMLILINVIMNIIYYNFIKKYVPKNWWWCAVMIYVFSTNLYLMNFSMLRQGLAISIFVLAVPFIIRKKILLAASLVALSMSLHTSAFILVPFVFWGYLPKKFGPLLGAVYMIFFLGFLLGGAIVDNWLSAVLRSNEGLQDYASYSKTGLSFSLGFVVDFITFIVLLMCIFSNNITREEKLFVALSCISCVLIPFQQIYLMAGRMGWYFSSLMLVAFPIAYRSLERSNGPSLSKSYLYLYVLLLLFRYYLFFNVGTFVKSFNKPFHTIFEVPWQ